LNLWKEAVPLRLPKLDERLIRAADLFPSCRLGADIGSDHGRLPLYLLAADRCERMVVSDISEPALDKAKALITRHHFEHRAVFIQADGLDALIEPVQAASLLGMGGDTMCAILTTAPERLHGATLILSPHTELPKVREVLPRIGYGISQEAIVRAGGRFYVILQALPGEVSTYTQKELLLGPCLIKERPPLFMDYLHWRQRVAQKALLAMKSARGGNSRIAEFEMLETYIREECI